MTLTENTSNKQKIFPFWQKTIRNTDLSEEGAPEYGHQD